ncbi:MAG: hypothetical protein ACJAYJ_001456 [Saprospiraceae bacterium]
MSQEQNHPTRKTSQEKQLTPTKETINPALKYMGMAFQMAFIIGLGTFLGKQLDAYMQSERPLFTILFSMVFLFLAFYFTLKDLIINKKD